MNELSKITSKHVVFASCEGITQEALSRVAEQLVSLVSEKLPRVKSGFVVAVPRGMAFGFIWFDSSEVAQVSRNRKPNGDRLVDTIYDENDEGDSWAGTQREVAVPPLVKVPAQVETPLGMKSLTIGEYVAKVLPTDSELWEVLVCTNVPLKISSEKIKRHFLRFSVSGELSVITEPSRAGVNKVFLRFEPGFDDAIFALALSKFTVIDGTTLIFSFASKSSQGRVFHRGK